MGTMEITYLRIFKINDVVKVFEDINEREIEKIDSWLVGTVIHYKLGKVINKTENTITIKYDSDNLEETLTNNDCYYVHHYTINDNLYIRFLKDKNIKYILPHHFTTEEGLDEITYKENLHDYVIKTNKYNNKYLHNKITNSERT